MTEQSKDREKLLRSKAAEAFTYKRPEAARKSIVDTSRLWDDRQQSVDEPADQVRAPDSSK